MIKKHGGLEERNHTFSEAWEKLERMGDQQLTTRVGTPFVARAALTTRGRKKGGRVIRYFQQGQEYARSYKCCWEHYYNCNRTRIGMYSRALDDYIGSSTLTRQLTRQELLDLIEQNGSPEGLDLSHREMPGLNLGPDAILEEMKLRGLSHTEDSPAWMYVAEGKPAGTILQRTNLADANLRGPDVPAVNLKGAILRGANLQDARLFHANLENAHLMGANLKGAGLQYANLQDADLSGANLQVATPLGANLKGAVLRHTDLRSAWLRDADLRGAHLGHANLKLAYSAGANFKGAHLRSAKLQDADLSGANLQDADLEQANLQHAYLTGANLKHAHLAGANLRGAHLEYANLQDANLHRAHLQQAYLIAADLQEVDLTPAVSLDGIHLFRARWVRTNLTKQQLGQAIGEEKDQAFDQAKEAYLALKNNFESIGRYDDASWAYVKERKMEKMMNHHRLARKYYAKEDDLSDEADWQSRDWWGFYARHFGKYVLDWSVELVCGYGESAGRVLGLMAAMLLFVGPALTACLGGLYWTGSSLGVYSGLASDWQRFLYKYLQSLVYMLDTFTTASFSELVPRTDAVRLLSGIMAMVGVFLAGLLGFVAGNRIRRS